MSKAELQDADLIPFCDLSKDGWMEAHLVISTGTSRLCHCNPLGSKVFLGSWDVLTCPDICAFFFSVAYKHI